MQVQGWWFPGPVEHIDQLDLGPAASRNTTTFDAIGFGGKLDVHPGQLAATNEARTPAAEEIRWAQRTVAAVSPGPEGSSGVTVAAGQMVDRPVLIRAERLLARANTQSNGNL